MRSRAEKLRPEHRPPIEALFGKTRRRLLAWLVLHPRNAFYVRQLARIVGGSTGNVPRELARLEAARIVRRKQKGREVFFQANSRSPVYDGLRSIFRGTRAG